MGNDIQPTYYNIVVWMDASFVANFSNAQAAKAYAEPKIESAIKDINKLFINYRLTFKKVFYPVSPLAPSFTGGTANEWIMNAINPDFDNAFPCINRDCILVLTTSISTGGGHGASGVGIISGLGISTTLVAHEIGHNLGLVHPTSVCQHDCNFFSTFMCGSGATAFNNCDYIKLADHVNGVFTTGTLCGSFCHCNQWTDTYDEELPEDFDCSQEPSVSLSTDQPSLVRGCSPDRSIAMLTVTVRGNANGVTDAVLRLRYRESVYDWNATTMGIDFHQSLPVSGTAFNDLIILDNGQELLFDLASNEARTFHVKIEYNPDSGVDPSNHLLPRITARFIYTENSVVKTKESVIAPIGALSVSGTINQFSINQSILITGDVILSGNPFNLGNSPLILVNEGLQITVPNGTKVFKTTSLNTTITGCNQMWKGIKLETGSTLDVSDLTVEDAQIAVRQQRGTSVIAKNCKLLNNNFGIYTDDSGSGNYDLTLLSNEFGTTDAGLKSAYSGQTPAPSSKAFAGIYLKNAGAVTINSDPVTQEPNLFHNLKYGIITDNTEMNVRNAIFEDIVQVAKGSGYDGFVFGPTGRAIYAQKGTIRVIKGSGQQLSFANCHTGVETLNATAYVWYTTLTGMTNGIITTNGDYSIHWFNTIEASDRGIELRHSSPLFKIPAGGAPPTAIGGIYANEITLSGNPKGIGINTTGNTLIGMNNNGSPTGPPQFTGGSIASNQIILLDGAKAIGLNATRNISAYDNTISLENAQGNAAGITMSAGDQNSLSCNNIGGSGGHTGIYAIHSSLAKIKCNLTANMVTGLSFKGMLMGKANTEVSGNNMKNNTTGLLYGVDAFTGTQEHQGNRWEGSGTLANHEGILAVAIQSKYTVDNTEDPTYLPDDWNPDDWFENNYNSHVETYDCPTLAGNCIIVNEVSEETQEQATEVKIARGELPGSDYQAANNWLAQRRLFERIAEEGNPYPGDTSITAFLTAAQTNGLAGFAALQAGIRQAFAVDTTDQDSMLLYVDRIMTGLDSLAVVEQQLSAPDLDEQDSLDLIDRREALRGGILGAAQSKVELLGRLDSVRAIRADTLLVQNTNLPDLELPYADNEKAVNNILLRTIAKGIYTFSLQDSTKLEAIAAACPLSDGEAVLWARALLSFILEGPAEYNDDSICVVERSHPNKFTNANHFRIYPNPATDNVVVEFGLTADLDQPLLLFNTLGQLVQTFNLPKGEGIVQVPLSPIPPGVYWYQCSGVATGKIIINR